MSLEALYTAGTGAVFGAALTASRVHLPSVIINQFRLVDFRMAQVFGVAVGASAVVMLTLDKLGVVNRAVRANSSLGWFSAYDGNIVGGVLVGLGMSLSGACPGTVLMQLAQGIRSARFTTAGAIAGGAVYAQYAPVFKRQSAAQAAPPAKRTISDVTKIPAAILYAVFGTAIAGVLTLTHAQRSYGGVSPVVGGLLIGAAQAASLLLTASPLGVSTSYEVLGQYVVRALGSQRVAKPTWPPKSVIFALGIVSGSIALTKYLPVTGISGAGFEPPVWQALLGGFIEVLGARLAGGCTSGHGLSGLGAMSFSSLLAVVAMFGAGILGGQLLSALT